MFFQSHKVVMIVIQHFICNPDLPAIFWLWEVTLQRSKTFLKDINEINYFLYGSAFWRLMHFVVSHFIILLVLCGSSTRYFSWPSSLHIILIIFGYSFSIGHSYAKIEQVKVIPIWWFKIYTIFAITVSYLIFS